jgi:hypothetical protein
MRCEATTRKGEPWTQRALAQDTVCASHAGRCGARPGNRNALRHGLYSRHLTAAEKLDLLAAKTVEGLDEEIAFTRLMIVRALQEQNWPPETYARLVEALCRQLRARRQLNNPTGDKLAEAFGTILNEIATEMGLEDE